MSRSQKDTPSRQRRKARRAIKRALETSAELQGASRRRQRVRADGQANAAASADRDVIDLRDEFNGDKREIFATGLVPDGTPYRGKTGSYR